MESLNNKAEKITAYQEKYIPPALRSEKKSNLIKDTLLDKFYFKEAEVSGIENLPESGPFIIVSNHFNVKETETVLGLLQDYDAHVVASEKVHGEHPIRKIGLQILRSITSPESLAHLSGQEKEDLLERIPDKFIREKYEEIIEREQSGEVDVSGMMKFVRGSTALLSRGSVLVMYPEGLWLYDGENDSPRSHSLYKGYDGFNIIAEQYKKLTGDEIPIIPVSCFEKGGERQVSFGKTKFLSENDSEDSDTDWIMNDVAAMLPEEQRGYYG